VRELIRSGKVGNFIDGPGKMEVYRPSCVAVVFFLLKK